MPVIHILQEAGKYALRRSLMRFYTGRKDREFCCWLCAVLGNGFSPLSPAPTFFKYLE